MTFHNILMNANGLIIFVLGVVLFFYAIKRTRLNYEGARANNIKLFVIAVGLLIFGGVLIYRSMFL